MKILPRTVKSEMIRDALYVRLAETYEDYAKEKGIPPKQISGKLVIFVDLSTRAKPEKGEPTFEPALPTDDDKTLYDKFWKFCDLDYVFVEKQANKLVKHDKPIVEAAIAREIPEEKN